MASEKSQHKSVLIAIAAFTTIILIVGIVGYFTIGNEPEVLQGQVDVSEYRVSSKVPGRILEIRVKEGDYVHVGDTLAILDAPEVQAKKMQAEGAESAATAMRAMMVQQLGFAMMPLLLKASAPLISGTTRGTSGLRRKAELLSM